MFCSHCGGKLPEGLGTFCPNCGVQAGNASASRPAVTPTLQIPDTASLMPFLKGGAAVAMVILLFQRWVLVPDWMVEQWDVGRIIPHSLLGIRELFANLRDWYAWMHVGATVILILGLITALLLVVFLYRLARKQFNAEGMGKEAFNVAIIFAAVSLLALWGFNYWLVLETGASGHEVLGFGWMFYILAGLAVVVRVFGFKKASSRSAFPAKKQLKISPEAQSRIWSRAGLCRFCGGELSGATKDYCLPCDKFQGHFCTSCTRKNPPDTEFCESCGDTL